MREAHPPIYAAAPKSGLLRWRAYGVAGQQHNITSNKIFYKPRFCAAGCTKTWLMLVAGSREYSLVTLTCNIQVEEIHKGQKIRIHTVHTSSISLVRPDLY